MRIGVSKTARIARFYPNQHELPKFPSLKTLSKTGRLNKIHAAGFTLVETVMSLALMGIMVAGIMTAVHGGFLLMGLVRENQRATQIMLEKMETIRLYSWPQISTAGFIPSSFTNCYDPQAPTGSQGVVYYGTISQTNFPYSTSYSGNLRQFTISVTWKGTGGLDRTRTFSTFIAKDGVQNYVY